MRDDEAVNYIDKQSDPVKIWKRVKGKYARVSNAAGDMANEALFLFEHGVDETENQTLSRFGVLKRNCKYHRVTVTPDQERRILLGRINPQYQQIKTNFQLADTKPTIEKI